MELVPKIGTRFIKKLKFNDKEDKRKYRFGKINFFSGFVDGIKKCIIIVLSK